MPDKIFIDSNIFLYAFCDRDITKQKIAKDIVLADATISTQVLNEVSVNMLRKLQFDESGIVNFVTSSFNRYRVVTLSRKIFCVASEIRQNYSISYYDSVIIAAALEGRCTILYSEDMQHGLVFNQKLRISNPFQ